ncbi:MAG: MarR family winged helix-turn-helix transcriptional regulator [Pseudomonadota bacterium]
MADDDLSDYQVVQIAMTEIGIINQLAETELRLALAPHLSVSEFGVLSHFVRRGQKEEPVRLARAFQQAKSSMSATLNKLERKGLITLTPSAEDGRKKLAMITDAGRKAWADGIAATLPLGNPLVEEFGAERLRKALPTLQALRMFLDESRNERDGF